LCKFLFHGALIAGTHGPVSVGLTVLCFVMGRCPWACYTDEATDSCINP
jgi:hypothetical protein